MEINKFFYGNSSGRHYNRHKNVDNQPAKSDNAGDTKTRRAYLNKARNGKDYYQDYKTIRSGYYILEIVRPNDRENNNLYALDGTRNVNGAVRIVSRQRMYVDRVISEGTFIRLHCLGMDNFGRRADGWYVFYQTPDPTNRRDTYILSLTKC